MQQLIRRFKSTSASGPATSIVDANTKIKDWLFEGVHDKAFKLYAEEVHPCFPSHESTIFIFPSIIKACSNSQIHKPLGLQLQCNALKNGFGSESTVSNSIISMYAKFSDTKSAYKLFDAMPHRDTISWNSMINCYIQNGFLLESIKKFKDMWAGGFVPKPELIASVLSVCVHTGNFELGRSIHGLVTVDERVECSTFLLTSLIDLYLKCHDQVMAFRVFARMEFRNEVSWTAMVAGLVSDHDYENAMDSFRKMQVEDIKPNRVTLISVLPACAEFGSIKHGKEIHGYAIRNGFDSDFRFSSALIHMYCQCDVEFHTAKLIFDRSSRKDVVMWSCIISLYSKNKNGAGAEEAIRLFSAMQKEGIEPNSVTLLAVISACTSMLSTGHARAVHGYVLKSCLISELYIQNSLINMYAKCGFLQDSVQIFKEMPLRDSVSWTAIISACGLYGYGEDATQLFHKMEQSGMKADAITILEIITACNHAGLVEEGQKLFNEAMKGGEISLTVEHYACFIDLLGRAGKLEDACDVLCRMPIKPSTKIWSSLVSACKLHGNLDIAELLAHRLVKSEPENAANYTLLSMIYAESDNWHGVVDARRSMKKQKLVKNYGFSRI